MADFLGSWLSALAVTGVSILFGSSQRFTREGRLLLRIQRLGSVYQLLPESAGKAELGQRISGIVDELNTWLDAETVKRRAIGRMVWVVTFVIGLVAAVVTTMSLNPTAQPWSSIAIGAAYGAAITASATGVMLVLDRQSRRRLEAAKASSSAEAFAKRVEELRRGEAPTSGPQER